MTHALEVLNFDIIGGSWPPTWVDGFPKILTIYMPGFDAWSHKNGPSTQESYLQTYIEPEIERLLFGDADHDGINELAGEGATTLYDETIIVIVSDHGQTSVVNDDAHAISKDELEKDVLRDIAGYDIDDLPLEQDYDAIAAPNGGMAQIYIRDMDSKLWSDQPELTDLRPALDAFYTQSYVDKILVKYTGSNGYRVYTGSGTTQDLDTYFANRPYYVDAVNRIRGLDSARSGDIILLADYGNGYYFNDDPHAGEHGNLNAYDTYVPLVFSGPTIRKGVTDSTPARIIDIAPTIAALLNFSMPNTDGNVLPVNFTPITSCQLINSPGYYMLMNDLIINSSSDLVSFSSDTIDWTCLAFHYTVEPVTVDGNGHSIIFNYNIPLYHNLTNWSSVSAIFNEHSDEITIKDLNIRSTDGSLPYGVVWSDDDEWDSDNFTLQNLLIENVGVGIWFYSEFYDLTDAKVLDNIVRGCDKGIVLQEDGVFNNLIANNIFECNTPVEVIPYYNLYGSNHWNETKTNGTNIIGGPYLGGNVYLHPGGGGFSFTCPDLDSDGICDLNYTIAPGNVDYLPLSLNNTPIGRDINVEFEEGVNVTFSNVNVEGKTSLEVSSTGPLPPEGYSVVSDYYHVKTTANYTGSNSVCINYNDTGVDVESALRLLHYEEGAWVDESSSLDINSNTICGVMTGLSEFIVAEPPTFTAYSDLPVKGMVSGSYVDTQESDDVYEAITEVRSGGKPSKRYSYLEHKWLVNVTSGSNHRFCVEAYHDTVDPLDDFTFSYSPSELGPYTDMLTVAKMMDDDTPQCYSFGSTLSGAVYIRLVDTDNTLGEQDYSTVYIDYMYIEAGEPDTTPPVISDVASTSITSSSATITWDTDESSDSLVKYGTSPGEYTLSEYEPAMTTSHTVLLTGLSQNTTYYYVVNSTDGSGNSNESTERWFTTNPAGVQQSLLLRPNANGYLNQWSEVGCSSNWECVDEAPGDEDATYVTTNKNNRREFYNLEDHTTETGVIESVTVYALARDYTGDDDIKLCLVSDVYCSLEKELNSSYQLLSETWTSDPRGGGWTWSAIDSLQAGFVYKKDGRQTGDVRVSQLYVEVRYTQ